MTFDKVARVAAIRMISSSNLPDPDHILSFHDLNKENQSTLSSLESKLLSAKQLKDAFPSFINDLSYIITKRRSKGLKKASGKNTSKKTIKTSSISALETRELQSMFVSSLGDVSDISVSDDDIELAETNPKKKNRPGQQARRKYNIDY